MPRTNLDFTRLIPERDTFTDADGQVYEFRARADFGAVDIARSMHLASIMDKSIDSIAGSRPSEQAAAEFEQVIADFVRMVIPNLPGERISQMTFGQRMALIEFWNKNNTGEGHPAGETQADRKG